MKLCVPCKIVGSVALLLMLCRTSEAQVVNSSYTNESGEKVLRQELVVPVNLSKAWAYCTVDSLLQKWVAPKVHMELRAGGYRAANYNPARTLDDSTAIILPLVCFLEKELLVLKIPLNNNFPASVRQEKRDLYFIFKFEAVDDHHTRVTGSMLGWGTGPDWEKTYGFFEKGNKWTFEQLEKVCK